MIHTENPSKKNWDIPAVEGLSLDVSEGEVFWFPWSEWRRENHHCPYAYLIDRPTGGRAVVSGFETGKQDTDLRRTVGVLTETPGMVDNLSAEYNLRLFAQLYEVKDVSGQVEKYL